MSGAIKINGTSSGSTTITAPASGGDESIELSTALAAKAPLASPTFTGDVVWSGATLRAATAEVLTAQGTTSSTYTDLATVGPEVTITTGTKALVIISCAAYNGASSHSYASFAVSGASTISAVDKWALDVYGGGGDLQVAASRAYLVTGLTAGSNTFTMKYRKTGSTPTFLDREIVVLDMGS